MNEKNDQEILKALYRFSTPEISDALDACGIHGYLDGIKPIGTAKKLIGPAYTVHYQPIVARTHPFMQASNYIDEVPENAVIVIDNQASLSCSVWGVILTHTASKKHIAGTIVHGAIRDVLLHEKYNYPLYASGVTAKTGKNRVISTFQRCQLTIQGVNINYNDIVFADSNGVVIIPKDQLGKILKMVQNISKNEHLIMQAVDSGKTLKEAREKYHYNMPWEDEK